MLKTSLMDSQVNINNYTDFRFFLQELYVERCHKNPSYSIRSFAKNLRMDHSYLNRILKGKKNVSDKLVIRLGKTLGYSLEELKHFLSPTSPNDKFLAHTNKFKDLSDEVFLSTAKWYYFAILELIKLKSFIPKTAWIAKALGLSQSEINIATQRLKALSMLDVNEAGEWSGGPGFNRRVTNEFTLIAQKKMQRELLIKASDALDLPKSTRSQSNIMMAINRDKFKQAEAMIKKFRMEMSEFLEPEDENKNELYQLVVAFYPLTNLKDEKPNDAL